VLRVVARADERGADPRRAGVAPARCRATGSTARLDPIVSRLALYATAALAVRWRLASLMPARCACALVGTG
jgi:hypothetical protein